MTHRDLRWKAAGTLLMVASCTVCMELDGSPLALFPFLLALFGLPLIIHGKRVGQFLRAQRNGHAHTAQVMHNSRLRQREQDRVGCGNGNN